MTKAMPDKTPTRARKPLSTTWKLGQSDTLMNRMQTLDGFRRSSYENQADFAGRIARAYTCTVRDRSRDPGTKNVILT